MPLAQFFQIDEYGTLCQLHSLVSFIPSGWAAGWNPPPKEGSLMLLSQRQEREGPAPEAVAHAAAAEEPVAAIGVPSIAATVTTARPEIGTV